MYLITKWFGTFLFENNKIIQQKLFPKDKNKLKKNLHQIKNNNILDVEKELVKNKEVIVNEKRLKKIGKYRPEDNFFDKVSIKPEEYDYSLELLNEISLELNKSLIQKKLSSDDLQVIQMVNALDDLIHTSNLLSERIESWNVLPNSEQNIKPIIKLFNSIDKEISKLEKSIDEYMTNIAPNTSKLVGCLIGARLISYAGSLHKLSVLPSSTIQILGAEKALFRFKKEGGRPPKHGIIFQHPLINKAKRSTRGKIARVFANKISIAVKADVFTKNNISDKLKEELKLRIKEINN